MQDAPPPPPPPKPATADTATPSKHAALGGFGQCCGTFEEHAAHLAEKHRELQKAKEARRKSDARHQKRTAQMQQEHQEEHAQQLTLIELLRGQLADEQRAKAMFESALKHAQARLEVALTGTQLSHAAWQRFSEDVEAMEALNADMQARGLHFTVPAVLQPVYEQILRDVLLLAPGAPVDEKSALCAKGVLASVGYHFSLSLRHRPRAPSSGLQTQLAVLMKAGGSLDTVLSTMNKVGWAVSARSADRRLEEAAKNWKQYLQLDSSLSKLIWVDNFETIIWHLFFDAKDADYKHAPVPASGGLPAADTTPPDGCNCGPNSLCGTNGGRRFHDHTRPEPRQWLCCRRAPVGAGERAGAGVPEAGAAALSVGGVGGWGPPRYGDAAVPAVHAAGCRPPHAAAEPVAAPATDTAAVLPGPGALVIHLMYLQLGTDTASNSERAATAVEGGGGGGEGRGHQGHEESAAGVHPHCRSVRRS